jgi:hypothetical protein
MSQKPRNKRANQNQRRRRPMTVPAEPPTYMANALITKTYRFVSTVAGDYIISSAKVAGLISIGTTTTQVTQLFETVKINYIRIWAAPVTSALAPVSVSCVFAGGIAGVIGNDRKVADMSIGSTRVARIHAVPDPLSQAAQFQSGSTTLGINSWFTLSVPAQAVIDVNMTGKITADSRTTQNTITVATAVVSAVYYMALDNAATASPGGNLLVPDSALVTTV